ncbi:hypothetical protein CRI94_16975 [Longibacter salinarum]|uniref:Uncharacterized protein n=1 Tax=Longibacter salinarum TaxID=1850348 RepID=A0A2A8CTT5_9BACT|nr:hypothetical protein [Longibacter salinarum]PEN11112.1 hypothetical protein CRI94_16975 [Longibacter salinarum]
MSSSSLFPSSTDTESLSVNLPTEYAEWIQAQAEYNDVSAGAVIRQLVDNQRMRDREEVTPNSADEKEESVADNLRSASERLRELVDRAESLDDKPDDVLERIESRLQTQIEKDRNKSNPPISDDAPSMFDLMDD